MSDTPKLVLCLMVRNEAAIIERCLRAALPAVDGCVLSINNTTDDTAAIAQRVADELGVPIGIVSSEWKNFGKNRSKSVVDTRDWCVVRGWPVQNTYALLIDADHVLHVEPGFDRAHLVHPHYELNVFAGRERNPGTRLVRLSHFWTSVGVTHEYWGSFPDTQAIHYGGLWIEDRTDGGSKDDKHPRDVKLLKQGLKDEPGNGRYMFYLAETYYHMGQFKNAITWYEARIKSGGWDEEIWFSKYKRGLAFLKMNDTERGVGALLGAVSFRPGRSEPLVELATHYRLRGQNDLAVHFADLAQRPAPPDRLFVDLNAYDARPLEEIGIAGFYVPGWRERGFAACEQLLVTKPVTEDYESIRRTESFYAEPLMKKASRMGRFQVPDMPNYNATNPSIAFVPGTGFVVNVRMVNYTQERGRWYVSRDTDGVIRTENFLCEWDPDTGITRNPRQITWDKSHLDPGGRIEGLEDLRLTQFAGTLWCTATCCQVTGAGGNPRVVLGEFTEDLSRITRHIDRVVPFEYDGIGQYEKNWLLYTYVPGASIRTLKVIYGYDPFVVLNVDGDGVCTPETSTQPPCFTGGWRGSAPPVRIDTYRNLLVVHEVAHFWQYDEAAKQWVNDHNVYLHRFVELDGQSITRYSRPFILEHRGIEYCSGAAVHGKNLILTYGFEDREACWMELSLATVERLLAKESP